MKPTIPIHNPEGLARLLADVEKATGGASSAEDQLGLSHAHFWRYKQAQRRRMEVGTYWKVCEGLERLDENQMRQDLNRTPARARGIRAIKEFVRRRAQGKGTPPITVTRERTGLQETYDVRAALDRERSQRASTPDLEERFEKAVLGGSLSQPLSDFQGWLHDEDMRLTAKVRPYYRRLMRDKAVARLISDFRRRWTPKAGAGKLPPAAPRQRARVAIYRALETIIGPGPGGAFEWTALSKQQRRWVVRHSLLAQRELVRADVALVAMLAASQRRWPTSGEQQTVGAPEPERPTERPPAFVYLYRKPCRNPERLEDYQVPSDVPLDSGEANREAARLIAGGLKPLRVWRPDPTVPARGRASKRHR